MNNVLWRKIQDYNLDHPLSEYGFSTRLAYENKWPVRFTEKTILEYKKFMYLAATADGMVAPSAIVDIVWHQHLIFTQSYNAFCEVLGKKVEHIPSTHNRQEAAHFAQAKERTTKLYKEAFGEQPAEVWQIDAFEEWLRLPQWPISIRRFLWIGIPLFIGLAVPAYVVLKDSYTAIDNPYFIIGYLLLATLAFAGLELWNRKRLDSLLTDWDKGNILYNLTPIEIVYLRRSQLADVINGYLDQMLTENAIRIHSPFFMLSKKDVENKTAAGLAIMETIKSHRKIAYKTLVRELSRKPVFMSISHTMDAVKMNLTQSAAFSRLFALNFSILSAVFLLGSIRLATGVEREKPVVLLLIVLAGYLFLLILFLRRFLNYFFEITISEAYKNQHRTDSTEAKSWEWQYCFSGNDTLSLGLLLLIADTGRHSEADPTAPAVSCGSGCGSSCASCGGCGST